MQVVDRGSGRFSYRLSFALVPTAATEIPNPCELLPVPGHTSAQPHAPRQARLSGAGHKPPSLILFIKQTVAGG